MPNISYVFESEKGNTKFKITIGNNEHELVLMDGCYESDILIDRIQELFDGLNTHYGYKLKIYLDSINFLVTISNDTAFTINFTTCSSIYKSFGSMLGFIHNLYTGKNTYNGNSPLNIVGDQYIYMYLNDIGAVIDQNNNVFFAKIIVRENKGNIIFDNGSNLLTKEHVFKQLENIDSLKIKLCDPYGKTLNLYNQTFSFTLELKIQQTQDVK